MATHDYVIANQGFPAFRSDLNDALAAIVSNNSSATEPTTMFAHMIWVDTAANPSILKIRNADNDAWITIGAIDQTGDTFTMVNLKTSGPVVFNDAGADVDFRVESDSNQNALFVDGATGSVGVGTGSPALIADSSGTVIQVSSSDRAALRLTRTSGGGDLELRSFVNGGCHLINYGSGTLALGTNSLEAARIDASLNLLVGKTAPSGNTVGVEMQPAGLILATRSAGIVGYFNRQTNDGTLIEFAQANITEGTISVSGTTVSYNGGHLSRFAQTLSTKDESLKKGTILSNLDEMNVYVKPTLYWTEEDELPVDEEGNPTVAVGDVKEETSVSDNEQLNKVKVSDVEGDPNVAGVFVNWTYDEAHQVDEINMAMTGDMIIRIAEGVTVARGDLLISAGDGTAKPQGDDIVRSKTIAKVTSTHVTCTYEDGSYCVPCVLMAC